MHRKITAAEWKERYPGEPYSPCDKEDCTQCSIEIPDVVGGLPTDAKARKAIPIYSGVVRYFPDALAAVAELSRIGNEQHNPGQPLHWDRSKSGDELDALMRHLVDAGTVDSDGVRHSTKVVWRALANLQKELEIAAAAKTVVAQIAEEAQGRG